MAPDPDPVVPPAGDGTPTLPDYRLLRVIGRGSYGEVWEAEDALARRCAIKLVRRDSFEEARPFDREFDGLQQYASVARDHPHLVQVLHVGRDPAGAHFYSVMELADADEAGPAPGEQATRYRPRTLRSELRRRRHLPVAECLEIGLGLASALRHLHEHGVVHRDVKPGNVIYLGGRPKLADFGLLARVSEGRSFVGTEGYIPPEGPGAPPADVFALGKLLYEVATGKDRQDYPEPPTDLAERADRDRLLGLNAVIHRACRPALGERYESAAELYEDLERLRVGQPVRSRRRRLGAGWGGRRASILGLGSLVVVGLGLVWLGVLPVGGDRSPGRSARGGAPPATVVQWVAEARSGSPTTREGFEKVMELCHRAMATAPDYAPAHAVLANAYREAAGWHRPERQAMGEARQAAQRAVQLDPSLAEAHVQLGLVRMLHDWDFLGAEADLRRAMVLDPTSPWIRVAYADLLRSLGRLAEARVQVGEAQHLADPGGSSINHLTDLALQFHAERDFRGMLDVVRRMQAAKPGLILHRIYGGLARAGLGEFELAQQEFARAREQEDAPDLMALEAYCLGRLGQMPEARALLRRLDGFAPVLEVSPYFRAYALAGLGDRDAMFAELDRAVEQRSPHVVGYAWRGLVEDSIWDAHRADPRWKGLLRRAGLDRVGPE
jgi:tetratricopeptide (TPR) repeat protein